MISLDEARGLIRRHVQPSPAITMPLASAVGRVLRQAVAAPEDFPAFDRSAMDGYALGPDEASNEFRVVGEIQPGAAAEIHLGVGECARIFTGAALPEGASRVIMQEDVERSGDSIRLLRRSQSRNIRRRGEDARAGAMLLEAGARLGAVETSLLAQLGLVLPRVSPAPRVFHIATGNELVDPSETPGAGQIRDSNSTLIAALLKARGAVLAGHARSHDRPELLAEPLHAAEGWDLLLISGSASVGDYDFGARALQEAGFELHFRKIALRPGKPLVFATRGRQAAFVIPGNPVSHLVTFHLVIAHALEAMEGGVAKGELCQVRLDAAVASDDHERELWWAARADVQGGTLCARPLRWQSSGDLCGIAGANALLRIPPGGVAAGALAEALLFDLPS